VKIVELSQSVGEGRWKAEFIEDDCRNLLELAARRRGRA